MFLGIEIGGTKLQLGVGVGNGTLIAIERQGAEAAAGAERIRQQIVELVPVVLARAGVDLSAVRGVGVGFGGPVDDATRTVITSHQVAGWNDFPLADWLTRQLGRPTVLANDSDAAGLAEALFGAGRGLSPVFYMNVGSGIGGALIIDGQIYRGSGKGAAEVGHLRIGNNGGDVESQASGWAIARRAAAVVSQPDGRHRAPELFRLCGGEASLVTAEIVGRAAAANDPTATALVNDAVRLLAEALSHVIALVAPRRIVIGGGVAMLGDAILFEPLRRRVAEHAFAPFAQDATIVPAALGQEVVVHGALALAARAFGQASISPPAER